LVRITQSTNENALYNWSLSYSEYSSVESGHVTSMEAAVSLQRTLGDAAFLTDFTRELLDTCTTETYNT